MIADFIHGFSALDGGAAVASDLQTGAQFFYDPWRLVEEYRASHLPNAETAVLATGAVTAGDAGGFVAHAAGKTGVTGTFVLERTAVLPRPPKGTRPYSELATFLAALHAIRP